MGNLAGHVERKLLSEIAKPHHVIADARDLTGIMDDEPAVIGRHLKASPAPKAPSYSETRPGHCFPDKTSKQSRSSILPTFSRSVPNATHHPQSTPAENSQEDFTKLRS